MIKLIDDIDESFNNMEQVTVIIDSKKLQGWQIAKPLNYEKKYCTFIERLKAALLVFKCKAIAIQFFRDLTEEEKIKYVKNKIKNE
jgi:hypothetical protein